jgi:hypothetical protein
MHHLAADNARRFGAAGAGVSSGCGADWSWLAGVAVGSRPDRGWVAGAGGGGRAKRWAGVIRTRRQPDEHMAGRPAGLVAACRRASRIRSPATLTRGWECLARRAGGGCSPLAGGGTPRPCGAGPSRPRTRVSPNGPVDGPVMASAAVRALVVTGQRFWVPGLRACGGAGKVWQSQWAACGAARGHGRVGRAAWCAPRAAEPGDRSDRLVVHTARTARAGTGFLVTTLEAARVVKRCPPRLLR